MQRALSYALSPAPGMPLSFLIAAPWFGVLAGLLLACGGPALDSRWAPPALAATHLLTLGFLGMAMAGSMLQLIPVMTGHALPATRCIPAAWGALLAGTLLLASAFLLGSAPLFTAAAAALGAAFLALFGTMAVALAKPAPPASRPLITGMRLAVPGGALAAGLGVCLALVLAGWLDLPLLLLTDLHAAWGLLGWVAMLVIGVGFQVIPMFQATASYPPVLERGAPPLLAALLVCWSASHDLPGAAMSIMLAAFAIFSLRLIAQRKRPADATTLYWRLSWSCLLASTVLVQLPGSATALAAGIVFIAGFAMSAVNGMLYKIVPFLLWYHRQLDAGTDRSSVPSIKAIMPDAKGRRQFWWHASALAALLGAVAFPGLARVAGALFAWACILLGLDLCRAAFSLRRRAAVPGPVS